MDDRSPVDQYKEMIEKTRKLHDELVELSNKVGSIVNTMDDLPDGPGQQDAPVISSSSIIARSSENESSDVHVDSRFNKINEDG